MSVTEIGQSDGKDNIRGTAGEKFVYLFHSFPVDKLSDTGIAPFSGGAFRRLVEDIRENGVRFPVFALGLAGKVIPMQGKQRIQACKELGIPRVKVLVWGQRDFDPVSFNEDYTRILTQEAGQALFDDTFEFTLGRYVSLIKKVPWV